MRVFFLESRTGLALLWLCTLLGLAAWCVLRFKGLAVSGLTREFFWGAIMGQAVFFVGLGAAAAALLLGFQLYAQSRSDQAGLFYSNGLFAAFCALLAGVMLGLADLGRPRLLLDVLLNPHPSSLFFWLVLLLPSALLLIFCLARKNRKHYQLGLALPGWFRNWQYPALGLGLALLLALALFFQSLGGRVFWQGAAFSLRLWASSLSAGAALLLLLVEPGRAGKEDAFTARLRYYLLLVIIAGLSAKLLFFGLDLFAAFYGGEAALARSYQLLFGAAGGLRWYGVFVWLAALLSFGSWALLLLAAGRRNPRLLPFVLAMLLLAAWLDCALILPLGGLGPGLSALAGSTASAPYLPTAAELLFSLGVWSFALILFRRLALQPVVTSAGKCETRKRFL